MLTRAPHPNLAWPGLAGPGLTGPDLQDGDNEPLPEVGGVEVTLDGGDRPVEGEVGGDLEGGREEEDAVLWVGMGCVGGSDRGQAGMVGWHKRVVVVCKELVRL